MVGWKIKPFKLEFKDKHDAMHKKEDMKALAREERKLQQQAKKKKQTRALRGSRLRALRGSRQKMIMGSNLRVKRGTSDPTRWPNNQKLGRGAEVILFSAVIHTSMGQ